MSKKKEVVRVHFMDGAVKGFGIEDETTVGQLKQIIVEKLELKDQQTFGLFEKKGSAEFLLDEELRVVQVMQSWTQEETQEKKEGLPNSNSTSVLSLSALNLGTPKEQNSKDSLRKEGPSFVFRKGLFFRSETYADPVARNLTYIQLLYYIVESVYPCSMEDAIQLAGIQFQVIYGDHKDDTHMAGFIEDKIKEYIPKNLLKEKKSKDWEALILKAHQRYNGKTKEEAELAYINYVKQGAYFGTEFFSCKNTLNKKLPDKVLLGVNAEGIMLLKKDQELLLTASWTELASWHGLPEKETFSIEILTKDGHSTKFIFETKQAKSISQLIGLYVDIVLSQTFRDLFH